MTMVLSALTLVLAVSGSGSADPYEPLRREMIEKIQADVHLTSSRIGKRVLAPFVMDAMAKVKRHELVPETQRCHAYENRPLPIGYGQTISQPYIVALMTDLLDLETGHSVLEVGTGSGYQAAILAECVEKVYTVEIIEPLGERARQDLQRLGYDNVAVRVGDGYYGWAEHAPFDSIVVTAAGNHIPPPLLEQLKPGGKMVIPIGSPFMTQHLMLVEKKEDGKVTTRQVLPVMFVPLTGRH